MEERVGSLAEALGLGRREHVALVGAGGKTTLLFALAEELQRSGKRVLASTTTKLWHQEALSAASLLLVEEEVSWEVKLDTLLEQRESVFLAQSLLDSGKVQGIAPSLADDLYRKGIMDYLLLEADGAAGHAVKAPSEREPVIPGSATKVVAMLGLEALGKRMEPEVVFRMEEFQKLTGLAPGEMLTTSALSGLFSDPGGLFKGTPNSAGRVAFLNKLDLIRDDKEAERLAFTIMERSRGEIDRVVRGSLKQTTFIVTGKSHGRPLSSNP
ncbi:MAG: selenium cofactor biosynthesis protein YqeC [Deltaproteobacteria bacterium]